MVGLGVSGGDPASGCGAAAVAQPQRLALGGGGEADVAAELQRPQWSGSEAGQQAPGLGGAVVVGGGDGGAAQREPGGGVSDGGGGVPGGGGAERPDPGGPVISQACVMVPAVKPL